MDVLAKQFRHGVMLKVTGVSNDNLQNWLKRGVLPLAEAGARHAKRLYSAADIVAVSAMVTCVQKLRMEAKFAAVVAMYAADYSGKLYGQSEKINFLDLTLYCHFKGDTLKGTFSNEPMFPMLWDRIQRGPYIAVPIGRIILSVTMDLELVLYGPHSEEGYREAGATDEEIAEHIKADRERQQFLLDESATAPPVEGDDE